MFMECLSDFSGVSKGLFWSISEMFLQCLRNLSGVSQGCFCCILAILGSILRIC